MCRWTVYFGRTVLLAQVVTHPTNSIIHQSHESPYLPFLKGDKKEISARNHAVNGDGFGVAWYSCKETPVPCVFTSISPCWNDLNLRHLAEHVQSHCIFAHVRAASPGLPITQTNCHPFQFGKILFMHNGGIAHWQKIKFRLIQTMANSTWPLIKGTTDSEHCGALLCHFLPDHNPFAEHNGYVLKKAMLQMMAHILNEVKKYETEEGITKDKHTGSSMNFAVTNGSVVIATRFRDSEKENPPSLYYSEAKEVKLVEKPSRNTLTWSMTSVDKHDVEAVIIASAPLTHSERDWKLVRKNHLLVVTTSQMTVLEEIKFDDLKTEEINRESNLKIIPYQVERKQMQVHKHISGLNREYQMMVQKSGPSALALRTKKDIGSTLARDKDKLLAIGRKRIKELEEKKKPEQTRNLEEKKPKLNGKDTSKIDFEDEATKVESSVPVTFAISKIIFYLVMVNVVLLAVNMYFGLQGHT